MTTIIVDTRSKEAKRLVDYLKTVKYVKVIDDNANESEENYDPNFVELIKKRDKQKSVKLDINNLWK